MSFYICLDRILSANHSVLSPSAVAQNQLSSLLVISNIVTSCFVSSTCKMVQIAAHFASEIDW